MGYQGFFLGQFQLEFVAQKCLEFVLDLLGFPLWPRKAEQPVISVAYVAQPSVVRVVEVTGWDLAPGFLPLPRFLFLSPPFPIVRFAPSFIPFRISLPVLALRVSWYQGLFHEFIHPIEVDIHEQGAYYPSLWGATEGWVVAPVLAVSRLEHLGHQA